MKLYVNGAVEAPTGYVATGFVKNVDAFAENGQCDEVVSPDMLNYIHFSTAEDFIVHLAKKVKHGGLLVLGGKDPIEVSKMLVRGDFNFIEYNRIMYGDANARPLANTMTINAVVNTLTLNGFKIMKKRLDGYTFTVEAKRL